MAGWTHPNNWTDEELAQRTAFDLARKEGCPGTYQDAMNNPATAAAVKVAAKARMKGQRNERRNNSQD